MNAQPKKVALAKKWHSKTRTGCLECRRRRVKCDESQPTCLNCQRRSTACTYATLESGASQRRSSLVTPRQFQPAIGSSESFNYQQMELMHHYCVSTCATFAEHSTLTVWFREVPPAVLLANGALVGSMLAVSGYHSAALRPEGKERTIALASRYLDQAVAALRDGIEALDTSNGAALNLASVFVGIASYASVVLRATWQDADPLETFVRLSSAVRSGRAIAMTLQQRGVQIERRYLPPAGSAPPLDDEMKAGFEVAAADVAQAVEEHTANCHSLCAGSTHRMYTAIVEDLHIWFGAPFQRQAVVGSVERQRLDWNLFCRLLLDGDEMCKVFAICYAGLFLEIDHRWYIGGFFSELVDFLSPSLVGLEGSAARVAFWARKRVELFRLRVEGEQTAPPTGESTG